VKSGATGTRAKLGATKTAFRYSLSALKIYSARDVYYRFFATGNKWLRSAEKAA